MQTLEPKVDKPGNRRPGGRQNSLLILLGGVAVIALGVAAVATRLGVIVVVVVAFVALCLVYTLNKGFAFTQAVAFLIHFDGVGRGAFTLGRLISVMVIILLVYKLLVERWRPPAIPTAYWLPTLVLVTWGVATAGWSSEIGGWFFGMGAFGIAVAYFLAAAFLVDDHRKVEEFLRAYWWGGIFGALLGVWGLVLGVRSWGLNGDPNLFGVLAASMIPLTIHYLRRATTTRDKAIYLGVLVLVLAGAAGAGSRSGVIGAAVVLFASIVYVPGRPAIKGLLRAIPALILTSVVALLLIVANPNTLERGIDSSGRVDFWNISVDLIQERPVTGHGLGQLARTLPDRLAITPGSESLADRRDSVSSHNTWLDVAGDMGIPGLIVWIAVVVLAIIALVRPRWQQLEENSRVLLLMLLPVLSGSMFLNMTNNKLGWSVIGLAAAFQVPSWGKRYRGYFAPDEATTAPPRFVAGDLARWDLKISQRFRLWVVLGGLIGAIVFGAFGAATPTRYTASMSMVIPKLDQPPDVSWVKIDRERLQTLHTIVLSDVYAGELRALSGVDLGIDEIVHNVSVDRTRAGAYLDIIYTDTDAARAEQVGPHLLDALDVVIETGRTAAAPALANELRPTVPGEQRYYSGALYLPVSQEAYFSSAQPRMAWLVIVGGTTGVLLATGFALLQQRRPRVNNGDDFRSVVGMPLWTHVGRNGRRNAATADQYAQVAVTAYQATDGDSWPRHMVVASPDSNRSARHVAMGVAASLAASGERVVLVDGQPERPLLSIRLGGWNRPGIADASTGSVVLADTIRRVNRWRLPRVVRRTLGSNGANLRLIPAGIRRGSDEPVVDPAVLDELDPGIIVVMLAPPMLGTVPVAPSLKWADVVLHTLVEGATVTFDAEDAGVQIRTFAAGPAGVVLADV